MFGTITLTGIGAAQIERANHASFYGVMKSFGNTSDTMPGRIAAEDAVRDHLEKSGIAWNSFWIVKARTIDTSGTKTPYKAEIDFGWD
jgi:hypothetical protein